MGINKEKNAMEYKDIISKADFIKEDGSFGEICPVFKKVVWIDKKVIKAHFLVSALGVYEAYFNDKKLGKFVFAPGYQSYKNRLSFQEYDVTSLIEECNVIDVAVGKGRRRHENEDAEGTTLKPYETALIAALYVEYEDGTNDIFTTDDSWECTKSNVLYSDIYNGEIVDFTSDTDKKYPVKKVKVNKNILEDFKGEEIREITSLNPAEIIKTPKGEWVLDFGQNLTGYVKWVVPQKKGRKFTLKHGEVLNRNGNFYRDNLRGAKAKIQVISDGNERIYKPHFTFQGFRYVLLEGFDQEDIKKENFCAVVLMADMKRTGFFACGDENLQQLYENIVWSQRGNFLDIPTDCPQRDERLGWTGDAQIFCRTASLNYRTKKFYENWLLDLALDQKEDGCVPDFVPVGDSEREGGSSAWGDAAVIIPYWVYRTYGDKSIIENQFNSMKKWIDYMEGMGSEKGLYDKNPHQYADWLSLSKTETDKSLISTAFFYYSTSLFVEMAEVIGENAEHYKELLPIIKDKFNEKFNKDKNEYQTQTALVLKLYFNLSQNREKDGERLIKNVEEKNSLETGFVGTPYILHVLRDLGRIDLAYRLLLKKDFPSWLYPVTKGATTIWERWDGIKEDGSFNDKDMNSFNHYAFGSVGDFLYSSVAGIESDFKEPGFKHIIFRPYPNKALGYAKSRIITDAGEIVSAWEYTGKGNECNFTFTIPKGCHATLYLDGEEYDFGVGTYNTTFDYEG